MKTLVRFLKPHKGLVALTLLILLIENAGTLLVPTMLANMVNVGITSGSTSTSCATACSCWAPPLWPRAVR